MKCNLLIGMILLSGQMMIASDTNPMNNNQNNNQQAWQLRPLNFLAIQLNPINTNEIMITRITPEVNPVLYAVMFARRHEEPPFINTHLIIRPNAINAFLNSQFLRTLQELDPSPRALEFVRRLENQRQQ